ncbi:MAG: NAD(P)-dependent oxidoreductase, partial [Verrucomicrobia bacterium]|nr:NAD(P)-dependent oxidoreductase [Verrucomicrobiota bacterium]
MKTIGFIGTGVMGKSMAGHLLAAGHPLRVYTRTKAKASDLLQKGAVWEDSPGALAANCDIVITIVGMPADVEEVYFGDQGLLANLRKGTVLIDMTTSSPELARRIADAAKEKGGAALDAPVSGGDKGAREAALSIMVGGERSVYDELLPVFKLMGRNIVYQGPAGSGQSCKMCNQVVIASTMIGVCEAMAYAKKSGLDPHTVLESISAGAAGSWALSNLAPRMIEGDFDPGFYVKHFIKDMG